LITERDILIYLNSLNIGNKNIIKIMELFDDIREVWTLKENILRKILNNKDDLVDKILSNRNNNYLLELKNKINSLNIDIITILDENYPERLKYIYDRPIVLYIMGKYKEEDSLAIAIVGSRKATAYGKWACEKFAKELVNMGITIVSGLALGIDSVAHKSAIEAGGRTIGVLGNGIDVIYPKKNYALYNEVAQNGIVFTEFPIGTQPFNYNFPQRNRIISGLSLGVVVIEAKEKSGSLITAHLALDQGKEVFALPGNINSIYSGGTNRLIKDGARPLLDIDDIIEEIYELQAHMEKKKRESIDYFSLSNTEANIIKIIEEGPTHCDTIAMKTGMDISSIMSMLTILELKGLIKELSNRIFTLN
jgi:DNA processing protein